MKSEVGNTSSKRGQGCQDIEMSYQIGTPLSTNPVLKVRSRMESPVYKVRSTVKSPVEELTKLYCCKILSQLVARSLASASVSFFSFCWCLVFYAAIADRNAMLEETSSQLVDLRYKKLEST